jgi:hypothetical protein
VFTDAEDTSMTMTARYRDFSRFRDHPGETDDQAVARIAAFSRQALTDFWESFKYITSPATYGQTDCDLTAQAAAVLAGNPVHRPTAKDHEVRIRAARALGVEPNWRD